jgi:transposase
MCPFDDDQTFDELRAQGRTLWYEHQRLLEELQRWMSQPGASCLDESQELTARIAEIAALRKLNDERQAASVAEIAGLKGRIIELEAQVKAKGGKGKDKRNKSERRPKPACTKKDCADPKCSTHNKPKKPDREGHGPRPQPSLPCDEQVHELPESERICTLCGEPLKEMQGQVETCEMIEVQVRGYIRRKHILHKYACSCREHIKTAPGPDKLIVGGRYSVSFGVEVAYDKYCDHQPLERQVRTMRNQGLDIDSQTLWDQIDNLSSLLRNSYRRIRTYIFSHPVIGADETPWWMMPNKGGSKTWQVWLCEVTDAVWYTLQSTRGGDGGKALFNFEHKAQTIEDALIPAYQGTVMVDGYDVYQSLARQYPTLVLAHCWSHARRDVLKAQTGFPVQSEKLLKLIDELFVIDAEAPKGPEGDTKRAALRATRSVKVLEKIEAWVWRYGQSAPPGSSLTKAATYIANQWEGLTRFLKDPRIPLHNNGSERGARTPVVGRKNHYGSRSARGAMVASILYTHVETARRSGMDPKAYLHLCAVRNLHGQTPVLPKEVTEAMLMGALEITAEQARRALRWRPDDSAQNTTPHEATEAKQAVTQVAEQIATQANSGE